MQHHSSRHRWASFVFLCTLLPGPPAATGQCDPAWQTGFGYPQLDGTVEAMAVFDDGSGPALYVGGYLGRLFGGAVAKGVAKYAGQTWSPVGPAIGNVDVKALCVYDDGTGPALYAGGVFASIGGVTARALAKWNGSTWSAVPGLPSTEGTQVWCMTVYDSGAGPELIVGGFSLAADGRNIARWNGSSWSGLGGVLGSSSFESAARSMQVHNDGTGGGPQLFVTGDFTSAGGVPANRIANWNGQAWSALSSGLSDTGRALAVFDDGSGAALYVGGAFTSTGGVTANKIAKWNGSTFQPLGSGMAGGGVYGLATATLPNSATALYAIGGFTQAGGQSAARIARWDGMNWTPLGSGLTQYAYPVGNALTVFDDGSGSGSKLFAGGLFGFAGPIMSPSLAAWNGQAWSRPSNAQGTNGYVWSLGVVDDGSGPRLYASGDFNLAGGTFARYVVKWDGSQWTSLSTFGDSFVWDFATYNDGAGGALYAGGSFTYIGGVTAAHVARWNNSSWSPLGSGVNSTVGALLSADFGTGSLLYVGGSFTMAGGQPANRIAQWNGTIWSPMGQGFDNAVWDLAVFNDGAGPALYAAGNFTASGTTTVNHIAKWTGSEWAPLGTGVNGFADTLAVYDDGNGSGPGLYVGGFFGIAGGLPANFVAKWNGTMWEALGSGMDNTVNSLTVFDDDRDGVPSLFAGGTFTSAGGNSASRVAKWNGLVWSPLAQGMSQAGSTNHVEVFAMRAFDDGLGGGPALFVGGSFHQAGNAYSSHIAKWGCAAPIPCPPDINSSGTVDINDLLAVINAWGACPAPPATCPADVNGDATVNVNDLLAVIIGWGPCP